jgi:hypothetical protein
MFDARRPLGRLFCLLLLVLAALQVSQAQNPATTTINDIVYRADGTPAGGTLLISWPVFNTAGGQAVAAGTKSVTLGTGGALAVALVPNTGATPSGTFYTVVYQLNDALTSRQIVDEAKFKQGLSKVIDGTVECLNASIWAKAR